MNSTINLNEPLCGLGEDYEPEIVWYCSVQPDLAGPRDSKVCPWLGCWPTESEAILAGRRHYPGFQGFARQTTREMHLAAAKIKGKLGVKLVDADLNTLKEWPV